MLVVEVRARQVMFWWTWSKVKVKQIMVMVKHSARKSGGEKEVNSISGDDWLEEERERGRRVQVREEVDKSRG